MSDKPIGHFGRGCFGEGVAWLLFGALLVAVTATGYAFEASTVLLCGLISVYGLNAVRRTIMLLFRLGKETRRCQDDRLELQDCRLETFLGSQGESPSLFAKHLIALQAQANRRGRIDQRNVHEAFATDLESANDANHSAVVRLPALGLMGTIVGLALMFSQFEVALQSVDASESGAALRRSLEGMGTALITTGFGCFWGLVLAGLVDIADRNTRRLTAQVAAWADLIVIEPSDKASTDPDDGCDDDDDLRLVG